MENKKVYLNLYVDPDVKEALEAIAADEDRSLSNLCNRLLAWSAKWLHEAGDSDKLKKWAAGPVNANAVVESPGRKRR